MRNSASALARGPPNLRRVPGKFRDQVERLFLDRNRVRLPATGQSTVLAAFGFRNGSLSERIQVQAGSSTGHCAHGRPIRII